MTRYKLPSFLLAVTLVFPARGADYGCAASSGCLSLSPESLAGLASEPAALTGGGPGDAGGGGGSASLLQTSAAVASAVPGPLSQHAANTTPRRGAVLGGSPRPQMRVSAMQGPRSRNETVENPFWDFVGKPVEQAIRHLVHPSMLNPDQINSTLTEQEVHEVARWGVLPVVGVTMTAFLLGGALSSWRYTSFIPETLCTVGVAVVLGGIIRHMMHFGLITEGSFVLVDATVLNLLCLPIIIFEGGWFVSLPHFIGQFRYIMIFAVMGTLISFGIIGMLSSTLGALGLHRIADPRANFAFAALISATDPVATLATFSQLKIAERQPLLNTLVFGESMINDAVAIVAFNAVNYSSSPHDNGLFVSILTLFVGSMLLGSLVAAALILPLRVIQLPGQTLPEVFYIFLTPYLVYALAESCELSGIIACLFAGIVFRLYGAQHLTNEGLQKVDTFLETMGRFADSGVFILCGCSTALIDVSGLGFCLWGLLLCLLSRAVMVVLCGGMSNVLKMFRNARQSAHKQEQLITWKHKFMIWLSGLRGGIGIMLALEIDEQWCGSRNKETIINCTFFLVVTLLFVCGSLTEPCLKVLGLVTAKMGIDADGGDERIEDLREAMAAEGQGSSQNWLHSFCQCVLVGEGRQDS